MEVHGFTEAGSIDATIDDVRVTVPDDMANRHRQMIAEWEAEGNVIPPYVPPTPGPVSIYKSVIIRRLTEQEAAIWEAALQAAPAKMRLFFNSLEYFVSDDPDFPVLTGAVVAAFGSERAEQLLAPE